MIFVDKFKNLRGTLVFPLPAEKVDIPFSYPVIRGIRVFYPSLSTPFWPDDPE